MGEGLVSLRCKSGGDTMTMSACTLLNESNPRAEDLTPSAAQLSGRAVSSEVRSLMGELNSPSMFNAAA